MFSASLLPRPLDFFLLKSLEAALGEEGSGNRNNPKKSKQVLTLRISPFQSHEKECKLSFPPDLQSRVSNILQNCSNLYLSSQRKN